MALGVSQLLGTDLNVYVLFAASARLGLLRLQKENQKFRCGLGWSWCPLLPAPRHRLSFPAVSLQPALPVTNERRREDLPQYNQAEAAFKELDTGEMEDRKSFNILYKNPEKIKTGVKSYSHVTPFKQIEEYMACL